MVGIAERNGDTTTAVQLLDEFARDHPRYWLDSLRLRLGCWTGPTIPKPRSRH